MNTDQSEAGRHRNVTYAREHHPAASGIGVTEPDPALPASDGLPEPLALSHGTAPADGEVTDVLPVLPGTEPAQSPEPASPAPAPSPDEPSWRGRFEAFSVGDPGQAASVPARPDSTEWDRRDTVVDGFFVPGPDGRPVVELRAASLRGRSHRYIGKVRQDSYAHRVTADGRYLVAVVADGVSSGSLSHFAAEIVTRQGCLEIATRLADRSLTERDWTELLHGLATQVEQRGLARLRATDPDADPLTRRDLAGYLATTALFAVVTLERQDDGLPVDLLPYGDTSAWVLRSGSTWEPQQPVKNDGAEIASSRTSAIPLVPAVAPPAIHTTLGPDDALVLITDGIGDPLADGSGSVGAFLASAWARPPEALAFAAHVDFARKSHDDDRTALAIWPADDV